MQKLTKQETRILNQGVCPDCGLQLYRGPAGGGALNTGCVNGHKFWVGGLSPFTPERITPKPK